MLPIVTPRLELRDFRASDFEAVHGYASDPEVTKYLSWGPNSEDDTRAFLERVIRHACERPRDDYELAVVVHKTRELVGGCGLLSRRAHYREFEIGYCLAKEFWRQGIGSEAVTTLLDFGFEMLNAHRIYASVEPGNEASVALLEKLGFRLEGHQKADTYVAEEWRDSLIYALLEDERASANIIR